MHSTLTIKDLALDKQLDGKAMSAVHGGTGNQANGTSQSNTMELKAPVSVADCAAIFGPANIQVDSNPTQSASNYSSSANDNSLGWFGMSPI